MADTKITALTALTGADPANDVIPIVDVSDTTMAASGTTKKISVNNILGASGTATLASATITGDLTVDTSTLKVDSANNRVGVGTASPSALCEISAASNARVLTVATGAAGTSNGAYYDLKGAATTAGSAWYRAIRALDESNNIRWTIGQYGDAEDTIAFYTGTSSTKRFQIASDGVATWSNVGGVAGTAMTLNATGLGVATTAYSGTKLTVLGVSYFSGGASSTEQIRLGFTDGTSYWSIGRDNVTTGNLLIGNGSTRLTIDATGNVGIGVTSPAERLTIGSSTAANYIKLTNTGATNGFLIGCYNTSVDIRNKEAGAMNFFTSDTQRMQIDSSGNVVSNVTGTAPTLATNSQMVFNLTSNTNLRISVRGTDGVTRVANLTLA